MSGGGGLINELTDYKVSEKNAYVVIALFSLILIWSFNIFEIISFSSRGFALYYFLQCLSSLGFYLNRSKSRFIFTGFVALVCLSVVIFGIPLE